MEAKTPPCMAVALALLGELFRIAFRAEAVHEASLVDLLLLVCAGQLGLADLARKIIVVHAHTCRLFGKIQWSRLTIRGKGIKDCVHPKGIHAGVA